MSFEALQVAKVYRHLLKAMKKHVTKEENKRHFIKYATGEFRNCKLSSPSSIQHKIKHAKNYTLLLNSVHHHKLRVFYYHCALQANQNSIHEDLLFSYNIDVDKTDEMKRVLGKSAASVGLQLPEVYQP